MEFYNMLKGQRLILIKPIKPAPQPATMPVVAKSVIKRPSILAVLFLAIHTMVLVSAAQIRSIGIQIYCANRPKLAVLSFLFWILVEILATDVATNYIERVIGG